MKKLIPVIIFLLILGCEDKKDEGAAPTAPDLTGTYKLNKDSWNCDGAEDVIYVTIEQQGSNSIKVNVWDYYGDACDDGTDCYWSERYTGNAEGSVYKIKDTGGTIIIEANGDGIKATINEDGQSNIENYNRESSDIKTYAPVCS